MADCESIFVYVDASFDKAREVAIVGYGIFQSQVEHETTPLSSLTLSLFQIHENNNIRAEIKGAILALQQCPPSQSVILYTDCQTVCQLLDRRKKLERLGFKSHSKKQLLANADLYRQFYLEYDRVRPALYWLKGHTPDKNRSTIQQNFSYLDKEVRRRLRQVLRENDPVK